MFLKQAEDGSQKIEMTREEWVRIGRRAGWLDKKAKQEDMPSGDELKKGRFTEYCKREGFEGPCKACAEKAMKSDDASVRGMASFYLNTVKP